MPNGGRTTAATGDKKSYSLSRLGLSRETQFRFEAPESLLDRGIVILVQIRHP